MSKEKQSFKKKFIILIKKVWVWIVVITVLITIASVFLPLPLTNLTESNHTKFIKDNYVSGLLIPDYLNNLDSNIYFHTCGGYIFFSVKELVNGKDIPKVLACNGDSLIRLSLKLMNNRLYISATINSIDNGEVVGIIKNGEWFLLKKNMLNYFSDDKTLEIIDKYNNVALQLTFEKPNTIGVQGYFVNENSISVLSNAKVGDGGCGCFRDSDYKNRALKMIKKIRPNHYFTSF